MAYQKAPFSLYWSSLDKYETCPQSFLWYKGWGQIDVGNGPGRKKTISKKKSEHNAVPGVAIQFAIERLYNDRLWTSVRDHRSLVSVLFDYAEREFNKELKTRVIDWRIVDRYELLTQVKQAVLDFLVTMKHHKLIGRYAAAEVDFLGCLDGDITVGGRADLVIDREDNGTIIYDGKNSKRYKNKQTGRYDVTFTDPDQLRWYAMLFFMKHQRLPDNLGFIYYRYPYGTPILDIHGVDTGQVESGVDFVPCTKEDVEGLAHRAVSAVHGMRRELFDARPSPQNCRMCDFEEECPQRQAQKEMNKSARVPRYKVEKTFDDLSTNIEDMSF